MVFINQNIELEDLGDGISRRILAHEKNLMCCEVNFKKGSIGKLHQHIHEQIFYVKKGKFEVEIEGVKTIVTEGDSVYFESNILHGAVCLEDGILLDIFTPQREDFLK